MSKLLKSYTLGDMQAIYVLGDENVPELVLLPADVEYQDTDSEKEKPFSDSLLQIKIAGDPYMGGYAQGRTLRQSPSVFGFQYKKQDVREYKPSWNLQCKDGKDIVTTLEDERGLAAEHHLTYVEGMQTLRSFVTLTNHSKNAYNLELISSFSLGKISPFMEGDGEESLILHRIRSVWSMEGRKESIPIEDLQLEPCWADHAVRCERFGSVGSLPVNGFFPIAVIEDTGNQLFWGAQLAHNASWQMEVYRRGCYLQLSGGLADREFGHFVKTLHAGECFETPEAILSVCQSKDEEEIYRRLTSDLMPYFENGPKSEQSLPVLFNEYCTTWGNPSHENISAILDVIKDKGFAYFVIDCGWYKEKGVPWDISMGDYVVSDDIFPDGMEKTVEAIKSAGMKPGIWFEIDNVGSASRAYNEEELLLHRDGVPLTTTMRRFWDLRKKEVQELLTKRVIGTLQKYGFAYMKMDCNDNAGIGCDGAESLGEGLRQNQEASVSFIRKVKEEVPGIILENCASGGHKLEPLMLSECAMASFSDAHECPEIPVIAANLHRVMLPCQSQIWAVVRKEHTPQNLAYIMASTFLGRLCVSGDVLDLNGEQWKVVEDGIAFYNEASPIIKNGKTSYFGKIGKSYRHLTGWQGIMRKGFAKEGKSCALLTVHAFGNMKGQEIEIPLEKGMQIAKVFSYRKDEKVMMHVDANGRQMLRIHFDADMMGIGILLA